MRLVFFIIIACIGFMMPLWLFVLCAIAYAYFTTAYELIILGMLVDAQFGGGTPHFTYTYTVLTGAVVLIAELSKPYLVFYRG